MQCFGGVDAWRDIVSDVIIWELDFCHWEQCF